MMQYPAMSELVAYARAFVGQTVQGPVSGVIEAVTDDGAVRIVSTPSSSVTHLTIPGAGPLVPVTPGVLDPAPRAYVVSVMGFLYSGHYVIVGSY